MSVAAGRVRVFVPADAGTVSVTVPDELPLILTPADGKVCAAVHVFAWLRSISALIVPDDVMGEPVTASVPPLDDMATLVTVPSPDPVAVSVPDDRDSPVPTVISSSAPLLAVVRPIRRAVAMVRPEPVAAPGAT